MGEDIHAKDAFHHHSTGRRTKVYHVKEGDKAATGKKTKPLTLEAPVVLHYLEAPTAVKLTAMCFIAFLFISC